MATIKKNIAEMQKNIDLILATLKAQSSCIEDLRNKIEKVSDDLNHKTAFKSDLSAIEENMSLIKNAIITEKLFKDDEPEDKDLGGILSQFNPR